MSQTSYSERMTEGASGLIAEASGGPKKIQTYNNQNDVIPYGRAVSKVIGEESGIKLPSINTDQIVGVSVRDAGLREGEVYPLLSAVAVMRGGRIYVEVEEAVTPDSAVFVRFDSEPHVVTLTFSGNLITSNVVNGSINGVAIAPVTFATSNAATMTALATAIQNLDSVFTAVSDGSNVITITGSADAVALTGSFVVTLGVSQATVAIATVTGPSDSANLGIFRTDADTGAGATAVALSGARFLTSASAGGFAVLDINLP